MPLMSDSLLFLSYVWFFYSEDVNITSLVCGSELEPEDSNKKFLSTIELICCSALL